MTAAVSSPGLDPDLLDLLTTAKEPIGQPVYVRSSGAGNRVTTTRARMDDDLLITDQRSFRSHDPANRNELAPLFEGTPFSFYPEALAMQIDAGRAFADGHPPAKLSFGDKSIPNFRASEPAQTMLGATQKAWFLQRLRSATATWKIWGNSLGTPDWRVDPQHLPPELGKWTDGYGVLASGDWGTTYRERAEIFDTVRDAGITGFAIVSGDRHSFWAGLAAKALPPAAFEPVGVTFVVGSISAPGMAEANEHNLKQDDPLRPLFVANPGGGPAQPTVNLLLHHGVQFGAGIRAQRRPGQGARGAQSGRGSAPEVRRHGRPRLRHRAGRRRVDDHRFRLHPAAARAQSRRGRRPAALSRSPYRCALAGRRAATDAANRAGR